MLNAFRLSMILTTCFAAIGAAIIGLILGYHWVNYSGNPRAAKFFIVFYSTVSIVILLWLLGSIPA